MDYVEALGRALLDAEKEEKIRIANALRELEDSEAEPYLLEALDDGDRYVRGAAAYALSRIGTPMSEPKLIRLLSDPYFGVRTYAALCLGKLRSRRAVPRLVEALGDEEEGVVGVAVGALGEIGDAEAVGPLLRLLHDRRHVHGVLLALGHIGCLDAADAVVEYLDDEDGKVRTSALIALKNMPGAVSQERLDKLLEKEKVSLNISLAKDIVCTRKNDR